MSHCRAYLEQTAEVAKKLDPQLIERLANELRELRLREGKLYLAGLGGSAANCSHAAADIWKLCGIQTMCLTDNASRFTASANDEGWREAMSSSFDFADMKDALLVLSVGGGADGVSLPLITAVNIARQIGMSILGIVGRDGGYVAKHADCAVIIPTIEEKHITPHTEAFQMVLLHCLVSHPALQKRPTKW